MFAFALDNDELAQAWLNAVIWSMIFWLLISRPIIITLKTLIAKRKLEKKVKKQRVEWEKRKTDKDKNKSTKNNNNVVIEMVGIEHHVLIK